VNATSFRRESTCSLTSTDCITEAELTFPRRPYPDFPAEVSPYESVKVDSDPDRSSGLAVDRDPLRLTGQTVAHFRIGSAIGAGGMGVVYRAEDMNLRRTIALKFPLPTLHLDRGTRERFLHEARSAAALDHPNICSIHQAGETDDGRVFLAMPLYEGETLKERLARDGAIPAREAIAIARQVTDGVRAAHNAGIVHRDLKPANVMLLDDGTVKLLDFGIAKMRDVSLTATGALVGTAAYMSPEQIEGRPVDGRADLWAIGVMLYEMLTGRLPFAGDQDVAVIYAILSADPPTPSAAGARVDGRTDRLVATLLRKDPAQRPASAEQLGTELAAIADELPAWTEPRAGARGRRTRHVPRRLVAAIAVGAVAGSAALTVALLVSKGAAPGGPPTTLAVLRFSNATHDTASDYLALGMSAAVHLELSRLGSVIVPRYRGSAQAQYRDTTSTLPELATKLRAATVLHGTLQQAGDRLVYHVQLVDSAASGRTWERRYERAASDVYEVQRRIVADVVSELRLSLTADERARLRRPPTASAEAYQLFLRAGAAIAQEPEWGDVVDAWQVAQSFYSRARDVDPDFALARALLAITYRYDRLQRQSGAQAEQMRIEAEAAMRIDPGLAEAHDALAWYWWLTGDAEREVAELRLAIERSPNVATYRIRLASRYRDRGMLPEAAAELERALLIEPLSPAPALDAAHTYGRMRRYEEAARAWDRVIELAPDIPGYRLIRGHVYLRWHGTTDSLAAAVAEPGRPEDASAIVWGRLVVARIERRWQDVLTIADGAGLFVTDGYSIRPTSLVRAEAWEALGDTARARSEYASALTLLVDSVAARPDEPTFRTALGLAFAGLGRKEEAIAEARHVLERERLADGYLTGTAVIAPTVEVFVRAGDTDAALVVLRDLFTMHSGREVSVPLLRVDPTYDPLRADPRFERLLQQYSQH
jgi:eukaryotic-like serine/threonine-protein kinase